MSTSPKRPFYSQSPWLDLTMSNPDIYYIEKDVLLDFEGLKGCGKLYAGELDLKDPLVSPIFGSLKYLSSIKVFVSTHELFYPDCILLQSMLESAEGSSVDLTVKNGLIHDWVLFPIKEQDQTIQEIAEFLLL